MDHRLIEYNFQFLESVYNNDDDNFEKSKIMNAIDEELDEDAYSNKYLKHSVHISYTIVLLVGSISFISKIYSLI